MYILLKRKRAELLISPLEFFFYQVLVVVVYLKSLITVEPVLRSTVLCDQPELSGRLPKSLVFSSLITIISALLSSHLY